MTNNEDILLIAREIVRTQPLSAKTQHLRNCADELHAAWNGLKVSLTTENAIRFVAWINRTVLAINMIQGAEPPSSQGGQAKVKGEAPKSAVASI